MPKKEPETIYIPKTDWESEFAILLRYTERLEKINEQLISQQTALTTLIEKLAK